MHPDNTNNTTPVRREEGSVGPVIATIIILAVIILGGLYFWGERGDVNEANRAYDESGNPIDANDMNDADDSASIEADLDNTDVEDPNFEIQAS